MMNNKLFWSQVGLIAKNTFKETVRDRILYSLVGFAVLTIVATLLAASVSLGQDKRVIIDFTLTAITVFLLLITIFLGAQLLRREIENRTIYLVLSKPISREAFYLGKLAGLGLTILVSAAVMTVVFAGLLWWKTHSIPASALLAIGAVVLEAWLMTAISLLLGSISSPTAGAIYTFCLVLIGHSSNTLWTISQKTVPAAKYLLQTVYYLLPNLEKFNLRNDVLYALTADYQQIGMMTLYFLGYTTLVVLLGLAAVRKYEF